MSKIMILMFIILLILGGIGINKIIQDASSNKDSASRNTHQNPQMNNQIYQYTSNTQNSNSSNQSVSQNTETSSNLATGDTVNHQPPSSYQYQ
ncbi:MAG: hypothetical protein HVN35_10005 [Methanobacteriaceae archaeon]|nr:hypothetical protein [Methanobacteriaceae archaeon]